VVGTRAHPEPFGGRVAQPDVRTMGGARVLVAPVPGGLARIDRPLTDGLSSPGRSFFEICESLVLTLVTLDFTS